MNFSLEIGLKTDLNTLPNIKDVYITLLRGDQYKDVANKAKELVKLGKNPVPHFPARSIKNKDELYSIYIHLYNSFHWQAGTVSTMYELPDHHNLKMNMPFWNPVLHSYLSKMPESWGRGLETRTLKYPLKENLSKKFDIMNVLNLGPHSYQYDVNRFSDPFLEILISG